MPQYLRKLSKGNKWYYKFDFNNRTYFSRAIYLTKGEAKKAEAEKYSEVQHYQRSPNSISLLQAINERLDTLKVKKSHKYYKDSKYYLGILYDYIGNKEINTISKAEINELLLQVADEAKNQGRDNYKVNALLRVIKAMFNQVISDHDLNLKNPANGIKQFPIRKQLKYIPSDEEIKQVELLCNRRQRLLIYFVMETGARVSEALRVKGKDINENYIVLYTRKSLNSDLIPRKVPRPFCLRNIVLKPDELLFPEWIEKPKFLSRKISFLNQREWNWHNLRHRYASQLSKQGKPLYEIMSLLGHSQLKTTQVYLQLIQ